MDTSSKELEKSLIIARSVEAAIKQSILINNHQQHSQKGNESLENILKVNSEQKFEKLRYRCDWDHNVHSNKNNVFIVKPKDIW